MQLHTVRTNYTHTHFVALVKALDAYLAEIDGKDHLFYHQYNGIEGLQQVVLMYAQEVPIACGAFKPISKNIAEVKRMYTLPDWRGKGAAKCVLQALELWAAELGFTHVRLETGAKMQAAIALYTGQGYYSIDNYEQYIGIHNSVCFEKEIKAETSSKN
jgi:putative acetyltransferase